MAAERHGRFVPVVAGVIAQHSAPSTEFVYPTAAQIKEEYFGARIISSFLGFFSPRWAARFDGYLERKARQRVSSVAHQATRAVDAIGGVAAPKAQFVREISSIYAALLDGKSPQDKLPSLAEEFTASKASADDRLNENDGYPLLSRLAMLPGLGSRLGGHKRTLRAFTPEILQGVEQFLKRHGASVQPIPTPEYPSAIRSIVRRLSPQTLHDLPDRVEKTLTSIYAVLPRDGKRFKDGVNELCRNIVQRSHDGEDGHALTQTLLQDIKRLLTIK